MFMFVMREHKKSFFHAIIPKQQIEYTEGLIGNIET